MRSLEKSKEKNKIKVGKTRVEPPTIGIVAVTPNHWLHHEQDSNVPDKVTFFFVLRHATSMFD